MAMGLLDRVARGLGLATRSSIDTWINDYLLPANQFIYNNQTYGFGETAGFAGWGPSMVREISATMPSYLAALRRCPPAFGAQLVRTLVLSQARFTFRNRVSTTTPRRTFGTTELSIVEHPWTGGTTGDLVARMEWHAGVAGNAYVLRRGDTLRVLRPDWVYVVWGSQLEPDKAASALDAELVGYLYANGGFADPNNAAVPLAPSDVAHWAPIPDPQSAGIGMSWITPALRDMQMDNAATEHKLMFFANGATPNLVVRGIPATDKTSFDKLVDMMESRHKGVRNAYRTLYLTAGADATVVGSNLQQLDFANTQGRGETRISVLSRVPASVLGISEGLQGSALNAGNFGQARRLFADTWVFPTLQDLAASLATVVNVPSDSELWFDATDMPILREDAMDAAQITQVQASTIGQLVRDGFTPDSAKAAVIGGDMSLLAPIPGWVSVQLQQATPAAPAPGNPPAALPPGRGVVYPKEVRFDPDQPRDPDGKWSTVGGVGVVDEVAVHVHEIIGATRTNGGSSINVHSGASPTSGYMVSEKDGGIVVDATDFFGAKGEQHVEEYIDFHKSFANKDVFLGTWWDRASGKVFLDVSHNVQDRSAAVAMAQDNDQLAIWDVTNSTEIAAGGTGGLP